MYPKKAKISMKIGSKDIDDNCTSANKGLYSETSLFTLGG